MNRRLTARERALIRHLIGVRRQELIQQADRLRWAKAPDSRKHPRARP